MEGGEAGGRRLATPKNIRPTQGLVKGAIFDSLGAAVVGARVVDLFAGSGALGIEALSRGAAHATFVERDTEAIQAIHRNLAALGYQDRASVRRAHVVGWLSSEPKEVAEAQVVLLDPPYNDPVLFQALALLDGLVAEGATVVVERASRQRLPGLRRLSVRRERRHGDSTLTFFGVGSPEDDG